MPSHNPQGKSFNLLQFSPYVWVESKQEGIYYLYLYSRGPGGGGGGYFGNFWVGMCRWDPGTFNLYQS